MATVNSLYESLIERLARVTTSGRRIRELDGLRFLAIATVYILHVYETIWLNASPAGTLHMDPFAVLVRDERIGVDLFFVISGFILAMPFAAHHLLGTRPVQLKAYYWRRVTRLEPPYLLTLLLWYAVLVLYWHASALEQFKHLLASAVYMHNIIYHGSNYQSTINSVAWSLEVEVQFYVLAPLLASVFIIRNRWLRRGVLVAASILILQLLKIPEAFRVEMPITVLGSLPMFFMGFILADVYLTDWAQQPQPSWWGDLVALPGWIALPFWFQLISGAILIHGHRVAPASASCFVLLILCVASFRSLYVKKFLAWSPIMTIGGMCYTIYLLHYPMIRILVRYVRAPLPGLTSAGANTLAYCVIWGAVVLPASILFFLLVEKPCMQKEWPQRLWAALSGRTSATSRETPVMSEAPTLAVAPPATGPTPSNP